MLRVENRAQFEAEVSAWVGAVKTAAERLVVRMMADAKQFAETHSPVYSGDFASNWNVSYGAPDTTFVQGPANPGKGLYPMSFPAARESAWGQGKFGMTRFSLGQTAYLANSAAHDEPYAWKIENNQIVFRPVNQGKDRVLGKTFDHLVNHYGQITKGMLI